MIGIAGERVRAVEAADNDVIAIVAGVLAGRGTLRPGQHVEEGERVLAARQGVRNLGHGFLQATKNPLMAGYEKEKAPTVRGFIGSFLRAKSAVQGGVPAVETLHPLASRVALGDRQ